MDWIKHESKITTKHKMLIWLIANVLFPYAQKQWLRNRHESAPVCAEEVNTLICINDFKAKKERGSGKLLLLCVER